jgi:hypothetical protein
MRSKGTCVRGVVAALVVFVMAVAGCAAVRLLGRPGVDLPKSLTVSRSMLTGAPNASSVSIAAKRSPMSRTAPHLASSISVASSGDAATPLAQGPASRSLGDLPVSFEPNVGQGPDDAQFVGRGGASNYALTRDGIRISPARGGSTANANAGAVTLRFVGASTSLETNPQSSANSHKRHSRSRAHARSGRKPKSSHRSSHAAGDRQSRPRNTPNPSASERGSAAQRGLAQMNWRGTGVLAGETNYFFGNDPSRWRTHVSNFSEISARDVLPGVDVTFYGTAAGGAEYDVRVAPGADPASVRVALDTPGARWQRDADGDLAATIGATTLRMHKPVAYDLIERDTKGDAPMRDGRRAVHAEFALASDGTVGFTVTGHDPRATLVIDPSLTVSYFTFLGGTGTDSATSVAVDPHGFVYVGGTTTAPRSFGEISQSEGNPAGSSVFFVAKLDPTKSGAASLVYLTFIGGSGTQLGASIAVDSAGDVALAGTTTSYDYPVTDKSTLTAGTGNAAVNDVALTKLAPTGATLMYSTLFGGNGNEATYSSGGVAFAKSGEIFVAMDTTSSNLPVAPAITTNPDGSTTGGPFQPAYAGGESGSQSDGFLAVFDPTAAAGTSAIRYCTYLGIYGQATVTGIAVDSAGNAYLAGTTTDPNGSFSPTNGFQPAYGGDPYDGFVMKILPSGNGVQDLSYGTFLGGSGSDQALAIAVSAALPGTVYVTGATSSKNFPVNGQVAAYQPKLAQSTSANSNAFLSVITQDPTTFKTALAYSTYLGGSQTDQGNAVYFAGQQQIFIAGTTSSWDFPWRENLQPLNGQSGAFLVEMDPTQAGAGSLLLATPLAGSVANGTAVSHGNSVAIDASGNAYLAGDTNESDFPLTQTPDNGVQPLCSSCSAGTSLADAFVAEISTSPTDAPSVTFSAPGLNFGVQPIGSQTVPPTSDGRSQHRHRAARHLEHSDRRNERKRLFARRRRQLPRLASRRRRTVRVRNWIRAVHRGPRDRYGGAN